METCNPEPVGRKSWKPAGKPGHKNPPLGWFNPVLGHPRQGVGSRRGERCWPEESWMMGPGWVPGAPEPGLNAILIWRRFWHHEALCGDHRFAPTGTNTSAFPRRPSRLPKYGRLIAGPGGPSCLICWPLLPHAACNGSGSASPGLCLQRCSPARLTENQGVHGPAIPPGAGVAWKTPPPPTATGVTGSLHRITLAENFLLRGLIFQAAYPAKQPVLSLGELAGSTGLDLLHLDVFLSFHL